jgi:hypothetical protein
MHDAASLTESSTATLGCPSTRASTESIGVVRRILPRA